MTDRRHVVTDAHGRPTDLKTPASGLRCDGHAHAPLPKARHWAKAAVVIAAILATGLLVSVLLLVIRDVVAMVAGTSVTGFLLKPLFTPSHRQDR
ncbi:hypothetical protein OG625_40125 (plasmid) [Streptomyces sp. NBC_01351]|uniref:hypothetical protein n=1 Tax=Streptomyces sp. NBC_01351 TaxID=2903833 RepID=UPI002E331BEA|nr:hypothetical protein [Streptomyces sp. NBC_01351]